MTSYKSGRLNEYQIHFQEVLTAIARALQNGHPNAFLAHHGSYSVTHNGQTVIKGIIWQPNVGYASGNLPLRNAGVYILVSSDILGMLARLHPPILARLSDEEIAIFPNHDEPFRFFPVMAGEPLDSLTNALSELIHMLPAVAA